MDPIKDRFLDQLIECQLIMRGEFVLKSGQKSDLYINLRTLPGHPPLLETFVELAKRLVPEHPANTTLIGVPNGAVPIATAIAYKHKLEQVFIDKEPKGYGCDSDLSRAKGRDVILIEDVMSTGGSAIQVLRRLLEQGTNVVKVVSIIDRDLGAKARFAAEFPNIKLETLVEMSEIRELMKKHEIIK